MRSVALADAPSVPARNRGTGRCWRG